MADSEFFAKLSSFHQGVSIVGDQYFWKSEWRDEWFPLPKELNDLLNQAPNSPVMFGIYMHENPHGIYGKNYTRYLLDPTELVIWAQSPYNPYMDYRTTLLHELKVIDGSGSERQGDRNAIDASNCKYDFHSLELKHMYRPRQLPTNPITPEEPVPTELDSVYFYYDFGKWIPYGVKLQRALNSSEETLTFAIYQRVWPELFGGGYNVYFIEPKKMMQISASWKKTRGLVKIKTARDDSEASDGKIEKNAMDGSQLFSISYKLPDYYANAKKVGIFHQSDLDDKRKWDVAYNLDVIFYTVIACKLRASNPIFKIKYVTGRAEYFARYTEGRNLTGMILPTPDWPTEVVLFYFEGPMQEIQNLDKIFEADKDLLSGDKLRFSNLGPEGNVFATVGQGFLEDRMFGEWGQSGTLEETKLIFDLFSKHHGTTIDELLARKRGFDDFGRNLRERKLREQKLAPKVHQVSI